MDYTHNKFQLVQETAFSVRTSVFFGIERILKELVYVTDHFFG